MNSHTLALLGQRMAQERLHQNLTQLALSQRSGVAYSTLRKIEAKGVGSIGDYAALLEALGQLEQLAAWALAGQCAPPAAAVGLQAANAKLRQRARSPLAVAPKPAAPDLPRLDAAPLAQTIPTSALPVLNVPLLKSERLGLDFPYDWSNADISDTALIGAVLGRARFMDVSKIFAHFGMQRVQAVAAELAIDLHTGVLGALMPGIQRGVARVSHA